MGRRGAARGFRFRDPFDHVSGDFGSVPAADDQAIGLGDGMQTRFRLAKAYGDDEDAQRRFITRPVALMQRASHSCLEAKDLYSIMRWTGKIVPVPGTMPTHLAKLSDGLPITPGKATANLALSML